jgi:tryptophanyl-tRNA synthetase
MKENHLNGISSIEVKQEVFLVMSKFLEQPREIKLELMSSKKRLDEIYEAERSENSLFKRN